jgi:hypothetical protein
MINLVVKGNEIYDQDGIFLWAWEKQKNGGYFCRNTRGEKITYACADLDTALEKFKGKVFHYRLMKIQW